jgi:HAD superfamily hydrolase (TIGR01509 family)
MINVVRRAHARGIRTALLSNSWGNEYPVEDWGDAFDAVVISGQVGMRKPEPEIFQHTLNLVGSKPADAVFVDDTPEHVRAAVELGMIGVHHVSYQQTVEELEAIFGMTLTA